ALCSRRRRPEGERYLTVSVPYMPAGRWPGTSQKKVYVPGFSVSETVAVPLLMILLDPSTGPGPLEPCSPASKAMLCETPEVFGISTVTAPGLAEALAAA